MKRWVEECGYHSAAIRIALSLPVVFYSSRQGLSGQPASDWVRAALTA